MAQEPGRGYFGADAETANRAGRVSIEVQPEAKAGYQELLANQQDICCEPESRGRLGSLLEGDRCFPNFIGWVSNPTRAIDPRALTQFMPIFAGFHTEQQRRIPSGEAYMVGPAFYVALGERFSFGPTTGGFLWANFGDRRQGWIDLGFFAQYALIRNVENQFIFTAGLQVLTQWLGSTQISQGGYDPARLSPYLTFGKEFGEFHVLGTVGYQFPVAEESGINTRTFYASLHLDRRIFGWLYPLVEFNGTWINHDANINAPRLDRVRGFFNLGRFDNAGSMLTVAPGFNAVIVHNRLELGAVYQTPIYSDQNFRFHELLVKMVLRY